MDALDLLLGSEELIQKPQKKFTVKRLSKGEVKFELTLEAIHMDTFKHIQEMNTDKKNELDAIGVQLMMMTYGVREFNAKVDDNASRLAETCKKQGVANVEQLITKALLPGEIASISEEITKLSGFGEDTIEEVKNA